MRRQQEDAGTGDERKGYEIADEERGGRERFSRAL